MTRSAIHLGDRHTRQLIEQCKAPFAKAFAVFVDELSKGPSARVRADKPLSAARRAELESQTARIVARQQALAKRGKLDSIDLEDIHPATIVGARLRHVAKERGVTQKELADLLGVTPAVVNRVFKNPERSKVSTLKRIAKALEVDLHDII